MVVKIDPVSFFFEHAVYSYDPKSQTVEQGRQACAEALAKAEREGSDAGLSFEWSVDPDTDSSDFDESDDPWSLYQCVCRQSDGILVASIGGVDFGRDGEPYSDPFRRLVEAELAQEALSS